ncbi:MAG: acetylglutamate kinase [Actinomycetota bacterium]|jgi:acetylglutamate kinase|nr:acetylglutamate kinase [Actinomycetota bacterium]
MTTAEQALTKAATLIEALPYIRSYRNQVVVVKIGGAALDDDRLARIVAEDLALMALVGIRLVVVHGGGPQVSEAMTDAGLEPTFVGGLRVTDEKAMELVRRVLLGSINSALVGRLQASGLNPVGLSGSDGGLLEAERIGGPDGQDLGRVGGVVSVRPDLANSLLDDGYTPVVASIAPGADGAPLNVNADAVAGALAAALGATKLVFLTNVEGLYRDLGDAGSLVSELKLDELKSMVGELSLGMRPKAESAAGALSSGVGKVHILDGRVEHALLLEVFTEEGIGTQVLP